MGPAALSAFLAERYAMRVRNLTLLKQLENTTYLADASSARGGRERFAVRLCRGGKHGEAQLAGEARWLTTLAEAGLNVPVCRADLAGNHVSAWQATSGGTRHIMVFEWVEGEVIAFHRTGERPDWSRLGSAVGRLHRIGAAAPAELAGSRPSLDIDHLLNGARPQERQRDRARHPLPGGRERYLVAAADDHVRSAFGTEGGFLADALIIHGDLNPTNILFTARSLGFIDFDDFGLGNRHYDVATLLFWSRLDPGYPELFDRFAQGYREESGHQLAPELIDTAIVLRAAVLVGWARGHLVDRPTRSESGAALILEDALRRLAALLD